nr:6-bladed beta-propeller [uncultured Desulfuromonas sp.]
MQQRKKNKYFFYSCIFLSLWACDLHHFASDCQAETQINTIRLVATRHVDDNEQPLSYPTTIAYDATRDEIIVTDAGKSQLVVFNNELFPIDSLDQGRGIFGVSSCLPAKEGLYVTCGDTEKSDGGIALVNKAFIVEEMIHPEKLNPQLGTFTATRLIANTNNRFYVLSIEKSAVSVFDRNWHYLHDIVPKDEKLGIPEPAPIQALDCDTQGNLYFLSEERGRVFVYDLHEKFLYKFGEKGGAERKLARPRGISVDSRNRRLFIVDYLRHAVSAYTLDGNYLFEIGGKGTRPGWFLYPTDVTVDMEGNIYVTDTFNHRIQEFSITAQ